MSEEDILIQQLVTKNEYSDNDKHKVFKPYSEKVKHDLEMDYHHF